MIAPLKSGLATDTSDFSMLHIICFVILLIIVISWYCFLSFMIVEIKLLICIYKVAEFGC